jgi:hypothetical protein
MRLFKPLSIWGVECTLQWNDLKQLSAKQLTKVAAFIYSPNFSLLLILEEMILLYVY